MSPDKEPETGKKRNKRMGAITFTIKPDQWMIRGESESLRAIQHMEQQEALNYWLGVEKEIKEGIYDNIDWGRLAGPPPFFVPWQIEKVLFEIYDTDEPSGNSSFTIMWREHGLKNYQVLLYLLSHGPKGIAYSELLEEFVDPKGRGTKHARIEQQNGKVYIFKHKTGLDRSLGLLIDVNLVSKVPEKPSFYRANHEILLEGLLSKSCIEEPLIRMAPEHWTDGIGKLAHFPDLIEELLPEGMCEKEALYEACRRLFAAKIQLRKMNVSNPDSKIDELLRGSDQ